MVANWRFDEGAGSTAFDATSPAENATLLGGATWSTDVPAPLLAGASWWDAGTSSLGGALGTVMAFFAGQAAG